MTKRMAIAIVERRMRECSVQSADAKKKGSDTEMYKLNVAWHWLRAVRDELAATNGEAEERKP